MNTKKNKTKKKEKKFLVKLLRNTKEHGNFADVRLQYFFSDTLCLQHFFSADLSTEILIVDLKYFFSAITALFQS